jgi:hypothetical protein
MPAVARYSKQWGSPTVCGDAYNLEDVWTHQEIKIVSEGIEAGGNAGRGRQGIEAVVEVEVWLGHRRASYRTAHVS